MTSALGVGPGVLTPRCISLALLMPVVRAAQHGNEPGQGYRKICDLLDALYRETCFWLSRRSNRPRWRSWSGSRAVGSRARSSRRRRQRPLPGQDDVGSTSQAS